VIPPPLRAAVAARFGALRDSAPVSGGCVNHALRVTTAEGVLFLKHAPDAPTGLYAAEARGLEALRAAAEDLVIPDVLGWSEAADGAPAWLALEWLETSAPAADHGERLGRGLAALHRAGSGEGWGWETDNFIGPLPQANAPAEEWPEFWRHRRLQPQLDLARVAGRPAGDAADWERLFDRLPALLAPAGEEGPSLLHGDLWSGNVLATPRGPALVDPAVYRGHRETDLAMAELFGGFDPAFHAAYSEAWPLAPGWPARRAAYQLWYLLVHLNLFGSAYVGRVAAALRAALA
jgi:protein-ribulosamine 3-kinase